jgi:hypothetical protein
MSPAREKSGLKSTPPARAEIAWAQILVEINGVKSNCTPQQGWHANSNSAGTC